MFVAIIDAQIKAISPFAMLLFKKAHYQPLFSEQCHDGCYFAPALSRRDLLSFYLCIDANEIALKQTVTCQNG